MAIGALADVVAPPIGERQDGSSIMDPMLDAVRAGALLPAQDALDGGARRALRIAPPADDEASLVPPPQLAEGALPLAVDGTTAADPHLDPVPDLPELDARAMWSQVAHTSEGLHALSPEGERSSNLVARAPRRGGGGSRLGGLLAHPAVRLGLLLGAGGVLLAGAVVVLRARLRRA